MSFPFPSQERLRDVARYWTALSLYCPSPDPPTYNEAEVENHVVDSVTSGCLAKPTARYAYTLQACLRLAAMGKDFDPGTAKAPQIRDEPRRFVV